MRDAAKRPLSITIVGLIFIATGVAGAALHGWEITGQHPFPYDDLWALLVSLLALLCGVYLLLGHNWPRWLAVAWLIFHVALSAFHSLRELLIHAALLLVFTYLLFRPAASAYLRPTSSEP